MEDQAQAALAQVALNESAYPFLLGLSDALRPLSDPFKVKECACRLLGGHLNTDRALYAEVEGSDFILRGGYVKQDISRLDGRYPINDFGGALMQQLQHGYVLAIDDVTAEPCILPDERRSYASINVGSFVAIPLIKSGQLVAALGVNCESSRSWQPSEIALLVRVAERTWEAVERARIEHTSSRSEQRFRHLFDSIDQGFCTIRVLFDAQDNPIDYIFLEVNQAFVRHTGLNNAVGKRMRELMPELESFWFNTYGRIARSGQAERFEHRADAMDRWFDVYAFRIDDPEQRHVAILFSDITSRIHAEEALCESEARLRVALVAGKMATWRWDPQEDKVIGSDTLADLFGLQSGTKLLSSVQGLQLVHPEDLKRHRALVNNAALKGGSWHSEFRIIRLRDGKIVWLEERGIAVRDAVTGAMTVDGIVWDITQRKEAEIALMQANKAKDDFLAVVSHELKNPLNLIQLNAELLARLPEAQFQPAIVRIAEVLRRTVKGLGQVVDDLLDMSRVKTGKLTLNPVHLNLSQAVSAIVQAVQQDAKSKDISLISDIAEHMFIVADQTRIEQVVWNLLSNALKFTQAGGIVSVKLGVEEQQAMLEVVDNGKGIDPELLPHIFNLFVQEDSSSTRQIGGLGIGLALVAEIAKLHEGRVEAYSEGKGKGARFRVYLPLDLKGPPSQVSPSQDASAARLLLVEDNEAAAEMLKQLLEMEGYEVDTARNGSEGLEKAMSGLPYRLILTDIAMPGMDGYQMLQSLRAYPTTAEVPVIAVTGFAKEGNLEQILAKGFTYVVPKPVRLDKLLSAISAVTNTTLR